jgi:hypothetical protein
LEDMTVLQQSANASASRGFEGGPSAAAVSAAPIAAVAEAPPAIEAWEESVSSKLVTFTELSKKIGGNVAEQVCVYECA